MKFIHIWSRIFKVKLILVIEMIYSMNLHDNWKMKNLVDGKVVSNLLNIKTSR